MSLESSSSTAEIIARQMLLFNRVIPSDEIVQKIEAITKEDLQNVAQKIFSSTPTYTLLGCKNLSYPDYDSILNALK